MSFGAAVTYAFKNYANFYGVTSRRPFWLFILFYVAVCAILTAVDGLLFDGNTVFELLTLGLLVPLVSSIVRRLRDAGYGWAHAFWLLLPFVGGIILIILCAQASEANKAATPAIYS